MTILAWHPQARQDLLDIYLFIGQNNPAAAEKLQDRIEDLAGLLTDFPGIGTRRSDIRPKIRMLVENPYLIFYEVSPDIDDKPVKTINILRVIDSRRNLKLLF